MKAQATIVESIIAAPAGSVRVTGKLGGLHPADGLTAQVVDDELLALLAEQADQIAKLTKRAAVADRDRIAADMRAAADRAARNREVGQSDIDSYWRGVYDEIRAAWDAWALVELGTSRPSPLDLTGRPELARLWESVR